jgi:uncharacterized membrane protein
MVRGFDVGRIEAAIRAAERRTSGEVRVALSRWYFWGDVRRAGERIFARLHMERTRERNGVLIFVAPWRRRFVVLGDVGIHQRVNATFWQGVASVLASGFRAGDLTGALERAILEIGNRLAELFPYDPARDQPELADDVVIDS